MNKITECTKIKNRKAQFKTVIALNTKKAQIIQELLKPRIL
jgi:inosine/xanthosine triphosphate pyrophosphatase family protein